MINFLIVLACLLPVYQDHDYGWNTYNNSSGVFYTRDIYSSDMSQRITLPAVPVARLTNQQKLPILSSPLIDGFRTGMSTASNYNYEVKPTSAGIVVNHPTIPNAAYFIPSDNFYSMGLVNVTATNTQNTIIIGQIHFIVRKP